MNNKIQKAIDVFEKPSKHIQCVHKCENGIQFLSYSQDLVAAFETAIDELEKRIPTKPIDRCMFHECPSCGNVEIQDCSYCPDCGQAFDWK